MSDGQSLVSVTVGSRLFGTHHESSDYDFIHISRPSLSDCIRGNLGQASQRKQENAIRSNPLVQDSPLVTAEHTTWTVQHFFKLLAQGQTQALEVMFAPKSYWSSGDPVRDAPARYWHSLYRDFHDNKTKWLSKNTAAFVGYCRAQANKYSVKGERLDAVLKVLDVLIGYSTHDRIKDTRALEDIAAIDSPYVAVEPIFNGNMWMLHISCCNVKCPDHFTIGQAYAMYTRLHKEYGERAKQAKINGAIDWKALSHAARVTIEAKELLTDHTITLPLKEAQWIKDIKQGKVEHGRVVEFLDAGLQEVESLQERSALPERIDQELYNKWIIKAYEGEKVAHIH